MQAALPESVGAAPTLHASAVGAAWRLCKWDVVETEIPRAAPSFEVTLGRILLLFQKDKSVSLADAFARARKELLNPLAASRYGSR